MTNTTLPPMLIETLEDELRVFQAIEKTLKTQAIALNSQDITSLETTQHQLLELTGEASRLEQKRIGALEKKSEQQTLSEFMTYTQSLTEKNELQRLQQSFRDCINSITALKEKNKTLLNASEQRVQKNIQFWVDLFSPLVPGYSNTPDEHKRLEQEEHHSISTIVHSV